MTLPWFRFYHEFSGDPVVQCLAFEDQRHFVMVLCLKCSGFLDREFPNAEFRNRMICRALGLDTIAGTEALRRLSEVGLVRQDWQPAAWDKRQFASDVSTGRVKRFRSKPQKSEDSDTDTDTEGNVSRNVSPTFHDSLPQTEWQEWIAFRKTKRWPCDPVTLNKQMKVLARHDTATQAAMLENSIQAGWQGIFPPKAGAKPAPPAPQPPPTEEQIAEARADAQRKMQAQLARIMPRLTA